MKIRKGTLQDIDSVAILYETVHDYHDTYTNFPGWRRGIYPIREDAENGITEDNLFVVEENGKIVGTFILRHVPEQGYEKADWHVRLDYREIFVVYTFAVHPEYSHKGVGKYMLEFILNYASQNDIKAVRLDVYEKNLPAIRLYESVGFKYIDTVDLGYGEYGLECFRLYQKLI